MAIPRVALLFRSRRNHAPERRDPEPSPTRHRPWRVMGVVLATLALMAAMLTTASTAGATTQTDYGPPDLINLSALQMAPTLPNGQNYAGGFYSATPAQITSLENLETQAANDTISDHSLATGDYNAVLSWARSDADAELWALFVQAIQAVGNGNATQDQTNAVDWLTAVAQREGVLAADDAGLEYSKWAGLGISNWNNLINATPAPSESTLATFLEQTPEPYTDGGGPTNVSASTDGGYCVYAPPSPDQSQYTGGIGGTGVAQTCFTRCTSVLGCNDPYPTLQQFEDWGDADAADGLIDNSAFATASENIAEGATMGSLAIAGPIASGLGTTFSLGSVLSGSAFQQAVFPYAARASAATVDEAEAAAEEAGESTADAAQEVLDAAVEVGGDVAATGVGVIVAAVIFAIVTAVQEGLTVFEGAALPDELAQFVANAPTTTPDLPSMLTNSNQMQGLYNLFVGATLPPPASTSCNNNAITLQSANSLPTTPCLNATTIPSESSSDPQWVVTPQGSTSAMPPQPTITSQDAASGLTTTTYLDGNWFIESSSINGTPATTQSLRFQYTDWAGHENTAWLFAGDNPPEFLTVSDSAFGEGFDPSTCQSSGTCSVTTSIDFVGGDGQDYSASVAPGGMESPPSPPNPPPPPPAQLCSNLASPFPGYNCANSQQPSTTTLSSSPAIASVNQPVTLTASESLNQQANWGSVEFSSGKNVYCPGAPVANNIHLVPVATCTITFIIPGTYVIDGTYSGDNGDFNGNGGDEPSQGELTLQVVNQVSSTMALSASTSSPVVGQPVTYTATVSDSGPAPTGTVTFTNAGTTVCSNVALTTTSPYTATCAQTYEGLGPQTVNASYSGDAYTLPSEGNAAQVNVGQASSGTSVSASTSSPVVGQPVTYTATVSTLAPDTAGPAPTGTVTFTNGGSTICSDVALTTTSPYTATCSQTYQGVGFQTMNASYSGDTDTLASQNQAQVTVGQAPSGTSVSASTSSPVVGQPVTYTATVSTLAPDTAGPAPTGMVTFTNGSTTVCSDVALSTTSPYTATCSQTYKGTGSQTVIASYSGDTDTMGSQNQAQVTVGRASTSMGLSTSPQAPTFGQPVTFTASVSAVAPSTAGPALTGTVTFTLDGQPLATGVPFNGAQAQSVTVHNLAPGTHSVVATYSGDADYIGSGANSSPTVTCSQTITATVSGPLTVSASTCVEAGGSVSGTITIKPGGALAVVGGTLGGSVSGNGIAGALICGSTVKGAVTLTAAAGPVALGGPAGSACGPDHLDAPVSITGAKAAVSIQASTIVGPVTVSGGSGPVTIAGDSAGGTLNVTSNSGIVIVSSNTVGGPVTVSSNSSPTAATVSANSIVGSLSCMRNSVPPTDAGVLNKNSGPASGQCAALG